MKNKSQLKSGIILNYINIIVGTIIPIVYTPIMLRLLGQNEYGLYKLSASFTSYLGLISFGIGSAVSRYLMKSKTESGKEEEEKYFGLFLTIFRVIAITAFVVGFLLMLSIPLWYSKSLSSEELTKMRIIVFIMVCNISISFISSPYTSVVTTHERFIFLQIINIITTSVTPIVNLIVLYMGYKSIGMTVSSLVLVIITRFVYYLYVKKSIGLNPNFKDKPKGVMKEILTFSFWVFVANIVSQLYNSTDTFLIGMIPKLATVGVAVYNVGTVFNSMVTTLTIGISTVISPRTQKMVFEGVNNTELTDLAIRVGRIQCYIVTLISTGFIAFGQPFIEFYAGYEYKEAYWVAILVMIPNMIPLTQSVCLSIIVAQNKHRFRSLTYLFIAIINVAGTWLALKKWGIIGAAAVTGIALVTGQGIIMNWYYNKKIGLEIPRFWKEIFKIFIIPILMCVATLYISKYIDFYSIPMFIVGVVFYSLIYCGLNWLFVMNDYEKDLFKKPVENIINKIRKTNDTSD